MGVDCNYNRESDEWETKTGFTNVGPITWARETPYRKNKSIICNLIDGPPRRTKQPNKIW